MEPVFVFGSNLAGRHGAGAARFAAMWCGAKYGVGEGRQGNAYAVPTKDQSLRTLPLDRVEEAVQRFIRYAGTHPHEIFQVTKVGTGFAGYSDEQIAPMFSSAPENCLLPGMWQRRLRHPDLMRVIVAGTRTFHDQGLLSKTMDELLAQWKGSDISIVSGGAKGADHCGEKWAELRGLPVVQFPANWSLYGKAAGYIRNAHMAYYATHLVAFLITNAKSHGTRNMIEAARQGQLTTVVIDCLL